MSKQYLSITSLRKLIFIEKCFNHIENKNIHGFVKMIHMDIKQITILLNCGHEITKDLSRFCNDIKNTNQVRCPHKECRKKKFENTCIERYGTKSYMATNTFRKKSTQTCIHKYGTTLYSKTKEFKNLIAKNNKQYQKKRYDTNKKNNSFNISKPEELFYQKLCKIYGVDSVIRQYRDLRYPWPCDFYIKDFDFFIELNLNWTHGQEPFNPKKQKHQLQLKLWKESTNGNDYYFRAIKTWTERDVSKQTVAPQNNLYYKTIYSEEFHIWKN
jgi:hypothetical protein